MSRGMAAILVMGVMLFALFAIFTPAAVFTGEPVVADFWQVVHVLVSGDHAGVDSASLNMALEIKASFTAFMLVAVSGFMVGVIVLAVMR